jgi:hypothetical protein
MSGDEPAAGDGSVLGNLSADAAPRFHAIWRSGPGPTAF